MGLPELMFLHGHAVYEEGDIFGWQDRPFVPSDIVPIKRPRKLKPQDKLVLAVLACLGLEILIGWVGFRFL